MDDITEAIKRIINYIGDDSGRDGLEQTPSRFIASLAYFFSGYKFDSVLHLKKYRIKKNVNDMIVFKNIDFISHCEHHMLPMMGKVSLGYIPNNYIIGVGDIMKIIEGCTRKLQLQEKITSEIASLLFEHLESCGVAVTLKATHSCLMCNTNLTMHTVTMMGEFKVNHQKRQEFYDVLLS